MTGMECCVSEEGKGGAGLFPFTAQRWSATAAPEGFIHSFCKTNPSVLHVGSLGQLLIRLFAFNILHVCDEDCCPGQCRRWGACMEQGVTKNVYNVTKTFTSMDSDSEYVRLCLFPWALDQTVGNFPAFLPGMRGKAWKQHCSGTDLAFRSLKRQ